MATPDPLAPPLEALYWTQYSTWYPIFRKHAPKSTVIDIDAVQPELLGWLESDTFVLPEGSGPSTSSNGVASSSSSAASSSAYSDEDQDADEDSPEEAIKLEALDARIRQVIEKYDSGPVFPKLNWSAPLDAGFMLPGNSLQCLHPEDVYLLLKSSEFVGRDLEQIAATTTTSTTHEADASEGLEIATSAPTTLSSADAEQQGEAKEDERRIRPQLVLKKWFQLAKAAEFRCFVRSNALIAITQRDVTFYDHLQSGHLQAQIRSAIWDFWEDVMEHAQLEGRWGLSDYIFDVYLTKDLGRVWLVDVNAWLPRTDPLLWTFDELEDVHLREKTLRRAQPASAEADANELSQQTVRLYIGSQATGSGAGAEEEQQRQRVQEGEETEGWGESDVELRVLADRRMQSAGGTGATYGSNMVPKDLVDFAKTSGGAPGVQANMGVDEIVKRWNDQVASEEEKSAS